MGLQIIRNFSAIVRSQCPVCVRGCHRTAKRQTSLGINNFRTAAYFLTNDPALLLSTSQTILNNPTQVSPSQTILPNNPVNLTADQTAAGEASASCHVPPTLYGFSQATNRPSAGAPGRGNILRGTPVYCYNTRYSMHIPPRMSGSKTRNNSSAVSP